ncbi:APC amino acid permease [Amanita rubescens]|nr:APC amino acid permease [Amanita rubescens]
MSTEDNSASMVEHGGSTPTDKLEGDEAELARMGYKQELKRDLGLLQMSFSIISILTGMPSLFLYGLNTGGPAVMTWSWVIVSCFTMSVGLAMAGTPHHGHLCAHPTSGGPYFWAAMLSKRKWAPLASWITGWFNLLGQVAITTGISFACATFISTVCTLKSSFSPTPGTTIASIPCLIHPQVFTNTFGVRLLHHLNNVSIWWHAVGTFVLVIAILAKAPHHQSGDFMVRGWGSRASPAYVAIIGILMSQYTLTGGFDASAHMTEETRNAAMSGSIGIVMGIGISAILGWYLLLGLLFSIQDLEGTIASPTGQPVTQIFLDTVGEDGAIVLMVRHIRLSGNIRHKPHACTFSVTSNSRMMYAFARDGGIPGHTFFNKVSKQWRSPIRTVWLACTLSFILGLPSLGSSVAFAAATSIATIGLYISYGIPILLRIMNRQDFEKGPFHLGVFSIPVAVTAVAWIAFITIVFILPQINPVNSQTLNYAVVAVGIVVAYCIGFWILSARKWFTGPVRQIKAEAMGIDVIDPGNAEKFEEAVL